MDAGVGYGVDGEDFIWSVRLAPIQQDFQSLRPALILGTGSVQAGGTDQSAFILLAKTMEVVEGKFGIGLTGGYATDLPDFEHDWGLASATLTGYYIEMEELGLMGAVQWGPGGEEDQ